MTQIITSLAQSHADLIRAVEAGHPRADSLYSSARKIEATLLDLLADASPAQRKEVAFAILGAGSLKAIKTLPVEDIFKRPRWNHNPINVAFLLSRSPAYRKEAERRGFAPTPQEAGDLLHKALSQASTPDTTALAKACAGMPINTWTLVEAMVRFFRTPTNPQEVRNETRQSVADPKAGAALITPILKAALRTDEGRKAFAGNLETLCVIPSAGAAGPHAYLGMATYALLGLKRPANDAFEDREVLAFAQAIFSPEGRKALIAATGGLEAWLAGGWRTPPKVVADMEAKRRAWRGHTAPRRW